MNDSGIELGGRHSCLPILKLLLGIRIKSLRKLKETSCMYPEITQNRWRVLSRSVLLA